jgi:hypothetical protein
MQNFDFLGGAVNNHNLQFRDEPFTVDGVDIACCLEDIKRNVQSTAWFATNAGGAISLMYEPVGNRWSTDPRGLGREGFLKNAVEVAEYVRKECAALGRPDGQTISRLEKVSSLAIFPGFLGETNSEQQIDLVLNSYFAGRVSAGDAWPIRTLSGFAYPLRAWASADAIPRFVFQNIPDTYMGAIAWYTTVNPAAWGDRHQRALEEALRYQLKNPDNLPAWAGTGVPLPNLLLTDRLRPDDRTVALTACGLNENDVAEARGFADTCETPGTQGHTRFMLTQLLERSNLISRESQVAGDLSGISF